MTSIDKCPGKHCGGCHRAAAIEAREDVPAGGTLVLAALAVFLVPLLAALVGAAVLSAWGTSGGVLGGIGGFAVGLISSVAVRQWASRRAAMRGPVHADGPGQEV